MQGSPLNPGCGEEEAELDVPIWSDERPGDTVANELLFLPSAETERN